MQHSAEFYQKMFGFKVIGEDKPLGIVRLGTTKALVSLTTPQESWITSRSAFLAHERSRRAIYYAARRGAS
jgi:hypothetical protein